MTFDLLSMAELSLSAAVVIFGLAVLLGRTPIERVVIGGATSLWFVCVLAVGATYLLYYDGGLGVSGLGIALILPILILSWVFFATAWGRERLRSASLAGLAALQAIRILGVSFVLLYAAGKLPAPFAPVAGWGDIAVGATALPVAWWAARGIKTSILLVWNALGVLDLVAAVALGVLSSPGPIQIFMGEPGSEIMTTLPWIIIPCFLVPALMFVHLAIFWRLWRPTIADEAVGKGIRIYDRLQVSEP